MATTGQPAAATAPAVDDSVIDGGEFPALYRHLPRFWTTGVENGRDTTEPTVVSLYNKEYQGMWILLISLPSITAPYCSWSVKKVLAKVKEFREENCWIFFVSCDTFTSLRQYRTELETRTSTIMGTRSYDVDGVTFLTDPKKDISKRLGVLCEGRTETMCYPGYFLLTPDKECVQYCVIKDATKMYQRDANTYFAYPINDEVVGSLLQSIKTLKPFYKLVLKLRETYPSCAFGSFIQNLIRLVDKKEEDNESIFKWRGWAETFGGVLGGGLK